MVDVLIGALTGGILAIIGFVIARSVVEAQTTTSWTGSEIAIVTILPTVLALVGMIGMFMLLGKMRD